MAIRGCAWIISDSSVVPERGQPTTKTGRSLLTGRTVAPPSSGALRQPAVVCAPPECATRRRPHGGRIARRRTVVRMSTPGPRGRTTLAGELRERDDDALAELLRARPDLLAPVPSDMASLAARATTRPSVQRALDQVDRFTLQVLEVLAVLPEPATTRTWPPRWASRPTSPPSRWRPCTGRRWSSATRRVGCWSRGRCSRSSARPQAWGRRPTSCCSPTVPAGCRGSQRTSTWHAAGDP